MCEARPALSYILWDVGQKKIPPRPENPADFPESDARHWYDYEYAGWGVEKVGIPESTGDGAQGKHIILLNGQVPHPYFIEFTAAMGEIAPSYGIDLKVQYAHWDARQQSRLVDKAIAEAPDMIILVSGSVYLSTDWYRKINAAGIPVIASNTMPDPESFRYIVAWTGPDDWGQMRMLANVFAERLGFEGGYCIVEHFPGTSPYYARTWGTITELERVVERVGQHYSQPLSLKTLSYRFDLSAAYLGRLFRQETGKTFPRYLNEVRIEKAKDLLRTSSLKANQIAREVGYTDPDYFYDIFKRYAGLSPTEFLQSELGSRGEQRGG